MAIKGEPAFVGEGRNWEVYHIDCDPVDINGARVTEGVIRKSNFPVKDYVQKYESIKDGNLPTLTFCVDASHYFDEYEDCYAGFC